MLHLHVPRTRPPTETTPPTTVIVIPSSHHWWTAACSLPTPTIYFRTRNRHRGRLLRCLVLLLLPRLLRLLRTLRLGRLLLRHFHPPELTGHRHISLRGMRPRRGCAKPFTATCLLPMALPSL